MISKKELITKQKNLGLPLGTIEKDYILGIILASLFLNDKIKKSWIFKGGTCLKKAYFSDYRMSEDLDFTLKPEERIQPLEIKELLMDVFEKGREYFGLYIDHENIVINPFPDKKGLFIQVRVPFQSPLMTSGSLPRVKFDLSRDEPLLDTYVQKNLLHDYSDALLVKGNLS